jgi:hypothetical protein
MEKANIGQAMQTISGSRQNKHSPRWSQQTEGMIIRLFDRMAQLYRAKAKDYQIYNEAGRYTPEFELGAGN